jgi:hypothetical protein
VLAATGGGTPALAEGPPLRTPELLQEYEAGEASLQAWVFGLEGTSLWHEIHQHRGR